MPWHLGLASPGAISVLLQAQGSFGIKSVVGGAVSLPRHLHGLKHPRTGAHGWWAGLNPSPSRLEGGSQSGTYKSQCLHGGMNSPKWLLTVSLSSG